MHTKIDIRILKNFAVPAGFLAGGMLAWWGVSAFSGIPAFLLPSPAEVLRALAADFPFLLGQLAITMGESLTGFIIAAALAFFLATVFVHSKTLERGLYPYVIGLKITPVLAITPFIVMWFGLGAASKIIVVVLICIAGLLVNALKGLETVSDEHLDLFRSLSASKGRIFFTLRVPSSLPYFFAGLKVTTMVALTGAFVAEFISGDSGIGYVIASSTRAFETAEAFAAILMMVLGGLAFFFLVSLAERRIVFWQKPEEK
jgi:NitT/TauT family transport system permease protein